ncbi:hypothetical protein [Umezawaea sp.]
MDAAIARLRSKVGEAVVPVVVGDAATATAPGEHALVHPVRDTVS